MPTIFEYMGIRITFYSKEHMPIHIHAFKKGKEMIVKFHMKDEKIYRTTYEAKRGVFTPKEMSDLQAFVNKYKYSIIVLWKQYFEMGITEIKPIILTKKI